MKKAIVVILIFALMFFFNFSFAEEKEAFVFVGNIRFGMTIDEVKAAFRDSNIDFDLIVTKSGTPYGFMVDSYGISNYSFISFKKAQVVGYSTDGYLFFDESDSLSYVIYELDSVDAVAAYTETENLLIRQYGATDYSLTTGRKLNLAHSLYPRTYTYKDSRGFNTTITSTIHDYSERIIPCAGDTNVLIEHYQYTYDYDTMFVYERNSIRYSLIIDADAQQPSNWGL